MIREILLCDRLVKYDLERKNVKNVNIRIKRDLTVHVSAPNRISLRDIERILREKSIFILSALQKYEELAHTEPKMSENDDCVTVFGKSLPILTVSGKKNQAIIGEDQIMLSLKDPTNAIDREKAINKALEAILRETVEDICREVYPNFSVHCPEFPALKFRHMKSRWGSCNFKKHILTFNYALVHAPIRCIEYVVYHEFTHFIHPDHSSNFYCALSRFLPGHKELKKELEISHRY